MKIARTLAVIILILMPYSTVLSHFSPYQTEHTFTGFLCASLVFGIISVLLGFFIADKTNKPVPLLSGSSLFFFLGLVIAPPLMIGPPDITAGLLQHTAEEHFRFGLLFLAVLIFAAGFILIIKSLWNNLPAIHKGILIPFSILTVLLLWDNYSSYQFSSELMEWTKAGKDANAFFPQYDFHELPRTSGRALIYILIPWLGIILHKNGRMKKWVVIAITVFSVIGIVSFFAFNFLKILPFYFFLVPAIALAPAYWTGIALLNKHLRS